jgi:dynein heavy chain
MGVQVPPSARMVVLQEDKFKSFFNKLSFALKQHEEHVKHVVPVTVNLLRPHLEDIQRKIEPGMLTLTWTSMNIDGYMHAMHTGLAALEDLISKSRDLIENRIERNLKAISQLQLVELPDDESFTLDKFVSVQERVVRTQTGIMVAKNQEIEEAVEDLLELIGSFRLDSGPAGVDEYEVNKLRSHYSRLLYRAVLNATKAALKQIKGRVGSRASVRVPSAPSAPSAPSITSPPPPPPMHPPSLSV